MIQLYYINIFKTIERIEVELPKSIGIPYEVSIELPEDCLLFSLVVPSNVSLLSQIPFTAFDTQIARNPLFIDMVPRHLWNSAGQILTFLAQNDNHNIAMSR